MCRHGRTLRSSSAALPGLRGAPANRGSRGRKSSRSCGSPRFARSRLGGAGGSFDLRRVREIMCGFVGFVEGSNRLGADALERTVAKMAARLATRGPDDAGAWVSAAAGIALGYRRLAVMDLSPTGRQPMVSASGRSVIVYNGEVYNFAEIRRELRGNGHRFRGNSDTEVVLEACEAWGVKRAGVRCADRPLAPGPAARLGRGPACREPSSPERVSGARTDPEGLDRTPGRLSQLSVPARRCGRRGRSRLKTRQSKILPKIG